MSTPEPPRAQDSAGGTPAAPVLDLSRRFVRVTARRSDGFIAFDFALGEPELFAELLLPAAAFEEFCRTQAVEFLPEATS
ncbi:MAG: phenol 2-monooxygenase [Pseudomonadota bacterium]|nr:phenol 2-monooxygenase [Pseudomonadota bacterium]